MHLFGLTLIQFASFLGASVLVVAALYQLRLRRRTVVVSFAPLWQKVVRDRAATSLFERLRQILSFLLQVAFVFLVLLAVARPRLSGDAERVRAFAVVIDAGGSMQASTDLASNPPRTRLDEAKALARSLVARLGETDSAIVICAGGTPEPLTGFESDRERLSRAIDSLRAADGPSNAGDAADFAQKLVGNGYGRVFVFSDRPAPISLPGVHWRHVGQPLENVAITHFAARASLESPGEYEIFFEARNFGRKEADVRLRVESVGGASTVIEDRPLRLVPGGRVSDVLHGIVQDDMKFAARLTGADGRPWRDGLALDDRADAAVSAPRLLRVAVVGTPDFFLDAALRSDPLVVVSRVAPADYKGALGADVVIFDNCAPAPGASRAIYINPRGPGSPFASSGDVKDVFVDRVSREHPVMRFVDSLAELNVARSQSLAAGAGYVVLASCAGASVMLAREDARGRLVAFGFDLRESDLPLRVAFPKIVRNAIRWAASGETPGLAGAEFTARDESVSDLYSAGASPAAAANEFASPGASVGWELWPWLVLAALALTLCEWFTYHRRWTV